MVMNSIMKANYLQDIGSSCWGSTWPSLQYSGNVVSRQALADDLSSSAGEAASKYHLSGNRAVQPCTSWKSVKNI